MRLLHVQVALPLPEPKGFMTADRYKIQFTFDGEHLIQQFLAHFPFKPVRSCGCCYMHYLRTALLKEKSPPQYTLPTALMA